ncbi:MAG: hypothetical protein ACXVEF_41315 [Polyangiales bacterium]
MNFRAGAIALLLLSACGPSKGSSASARGPGLLKGVGEPGPGAAPKGIVLVGTVPQNVASITGRVWELAQRARRLKHKEAVKLQVVDGQQLVQVVKSKVGDDIPKDIIRGEGRAYAALGLIPADYDYEAETYSLLEEQLAGLYIPEDKTMYLSKTVAGDELEATLGHELVHALQDQYFGIGDRIKFKPGESDRIAAIHALAEGDATSAMIDVLVLAGGGDLGEKNATRLPDREPEELVAAEIAEKKTSKLAKSPRFLSVGLLAPYADGMRFVHGLRRNGGWKAVDAAWNRPPISTEQLLHLDKYEANEAPVNVDLPTGVALGAGFTKTYDDVFGEEEGRIAFGEWMDLKSSKKAAGGWGGDRVTLFEKGDQRAVSWKIVFDDTNEASEAFGLLAVGWSKRFGYATLNTPGAQKGEELQVWGAVPPPPPPPKEEPKPDAKGKPKKPEKPAKPEPPPLPALPPLPDAPGVGPGAAPKMLGCRALRQQGKTVVMLAGVPCTSAVAWSAEVAK